MRQLFFVWIIFFGILHRLNMITNWWIDWFCVKNMTTQICCWCLDPLITCSLIGWCLDNMMSNDALNLNSRSKEPRWTMHWYQLMFFYTLSDGPWYIDANWCLDAFNLNPWSYDPRFLDTNWFHDLGYQLILDPFLHPFIWWTMIIDHLKHWYTLMPESE